MTKKFLLLFFVLAIRAHGAAIALVSNTSAGSVGGTNVTTSGINSTGGSLIVASVCDYVPVSLAVITDNKTGNVWIATATFSTGGSTARETIYYTTGAASGFGSGHTFTATCPGSTCYPSVAVAVFSNVVQPSPMDKTNGALAAAATSLSPGSITPTYNNSLVVSGISFDTLNTLSVSGMTITDQVNYLAANHFGCGLGYVVQTTPAAINPGWSWTSSMAAAANNISFTAADTSGTPSTTKTESMSMTGIGG